MDKLSNLLFEVLTVPAVFLLTIFSIYFICIKISTTWYKKRLKQIQSYHEIKTNTPELQPYLDQGYQLLIVIQNNKYDSNDSKFVWGLKIFQCLTLKNIIAAFYFERFFITPGDIIPCWKLILFFCNIN